MMIDAPFSPRLSRYTPSIHAKDMAINDILRMAHSCLQALSALLASAIILGAASVTSPHGVFRA